MVSKASAVKKYIVTLSDAEREHLTALIHSGKHPAQKLLKARILLKADASQGGEGWSDSQIAAALQTSVDTVARRAARQSHRPMHAAAPASGVHPVPERHRGRDPGRQDHPRDAQLAGDLQQRPTTTRQ